MNQNTKSKTSAKPSEKRRTTLIIILALLLVVAVGIAVWALFFREKPVPVELAPDYAPQVEEKYAETMEDDPGGEKLEQPQGGGAVNLTYSKKVEIDLSDRTVSLMFANPSRSNQDMMLQVVVQDNVVVQSGLITPGHQVTKLDLFDNVSLSEGVYQGKLVVLYYQQDSGEKATVNTEIPLDITVRN